MPHPEKSLGKWLRPVGRTESPPKTSRTSYPEGHPPRGPGSRVPPCHPTARLPGPAGRSRSGVLPPLGQTGRATGISPRTPGRHPGPGWFPADPTARYRERPPGAGRGSGRFGGLPPRSPLHPGSTAAGRTASPPQLLPGRRRYTHPASPPGPPLPRRCPQRSGRRRSLSPPPGWPAAASPADEAEFRLW